MAESEQLTEVDLLRAKLAQHRVEHQEVLLQLAELQYRCFLEELHQKYGLRPCDHVSFETGIITRGDPDAST